MGFAFKIQIFVLSSVCINTIKLGEKDEWDVHTRGRGESFSRGRGGFLRDTRLPISPIPKFLSNFWSMIRLCETRFVHLKKNIFISFHFSLWKVFKFRSVSLFVFLVLNQGFPNMGTCTVTYNIVCKPNLCNGKFG